MNLDHLRYFKSSRIENITQSAQELYISQPALSRAMKHLESELVLSCRSAYRVDDVC